jgi:hypothetical protein
MALRVADDEAPRPPSWHALEGSINIAQTASPPGSGAGLLRYRRRCPSPLRVCCYATKSAIGFAPALPGNTSGATPPRCWADWAPPQDRRAGPLQIGQYRTARIGDDRRNRAGRRPETEPTQGQRRLQL